MIKSEKRSKTGLWTIEVELRKRQNRGQKSQLSEDQAKWGKSNLWGDQKKDQIKTLTLWDQKKDQSKTSTPQKLTLSTRQLSWVSVGSSRRNQAESSL